ncbi:unnamed protein product [Boreogadus saida]
MGVSIELKTSESTSKTSTSSPRARPPPPHPEPDLHLLTQSQTSTSSPRARPPPPHLEQDFHLLTQSQTSTSCQKSSRTAERLGTGGLWCLGGPETEAGDQGPAAPDQRGQTRAVCSRPGLWLRRADGGAKTLEDDITPPTRILESG